MKKLLAVCLFSLVIVTGCEGYPKAIAEARGIQEDAQLAFEEAKEERDRRLESGEATEEELERSDKVIGYAEESLKRAEESISVLEGSADSVPSLIGWVSKLVGATTGHVEIGLIGALIAGIFRARRNRRIAEEIVRSVEPVVKNSDQKTKSEISSKQSASARKVVDQAQGKKGSLGI